jgi:type II secretory pathway predicted ATPase ExeA
VIGPPGTGKSLLSGLLQERYRATHEVVTLGETPLQDSDAFLRRVLRQLGVELTSILSDDLQLAVLDRVSNHGSQSNGVLLVIDEAQSLSADVLETIRTVTNIMHRGEPRVFAVLCGGVKLDEKLVESSMEAFRQRVSTRCYLHPMNGEETRHYVSETIRTCGADPDETITAEAIAAAHHACSGVPRLLNQLLTQAIDCAEEADQSLIDERVIDVAWAQLQQLPSPMVEEPKIQIESTVVEFGELDDNFDQSTGPEPAPNAIDDFPAHEGTQVDVDDCVLEFSEPNSFEDILVEQDPSHWLGDSSPSATNAISISPSTDDPSFDQPVTEPLTPAKSSAALFGEFDEEEEIAVGNVSQRPATNVDTSPGIEDILQHEIVGISPFPLQEACEEIDECGSDTAAALGSCEQTAEGIISLPQQEIAAPTGEDTPALQDENDAVTPDAAPLRILGDLPETNAPQVVPGPVDSVGRDDTDILVIEEEVEVRRIDRPEATPEAQPVMSIDYQQMLSRMRSGT